MSLIRCVMTLARRHQSPRNQEHKGAFREQPGAPDYTVPHCRIPSELHRRLRHLVVDGDSNVTAMVVEMLEKGLHRQVR